jgi:two-component system, sensor histidine kinase LadS
MNETKEQIAAGIVRAQTELDQVLNNLDKIHAFDPSAVAYSSHALNNYLTVIDGTTDLILMLLKADSDLQVRQLVAGIKHASGMMGHLVAGLVNQASNQGRSQLLLEKVNLAVMVRRSCYYYQKKAEPKQITVVCEVVDVPADAWADRVALAAVLDNLLSNTVKYSPLGKQVKVSVKSGPEGVVCTVADEGPGLDEAAQAKLFQKGARLGSVPTAGEATTGYGLAVAKDLVESLGGRIWCETAPGQGARFSFLVPACRESSAADNEGNKKL